MAAILAYWGVRVRRGLVAVRMARVDLAELEQYYDTVPRRFATTEEVGPFTLFLDGSAGWPWYARPRLGGSGPYDASAVAALLARMRELEVPDGVTVRMLGPDDEHLLLPASGVAQLAFGPATDPPAGVAERDAAGREPSAAKVALLRSGEARVAAVELPEHGVVATGRHIPVGPVSEVVGVATLPSEQGLGLAAAVTRALVADAAGLGVRTLFLTASSERVARLYGRLGFRRVGTGYAAERGQY